MKSTVSKVLCLLHFQNYGRGKPSNGLSGRKKQGSDTEDAEAGQGVKDEGAAWRRSSRNLQGGSLEVPGFSGGTVVISSAINDHFDSFYHLLYLFHLLLLPPPPHFSIPVKTSRATLHNRSERDIVWIPISGNFRVLSPILAFC